MKGGTFKAIPSALRESLIVKPLSAMTGAPCIPSSLAKNPQSLVKAGSDTDPRYAGEISNR